MRDLTVNLASNERTRDPRSVVRPHHWSLHDGRRLSAPVGGPECFGPDRANAAGDPDWVLVYRRLPRAIPDPMQLVRTHGPIEKMPKRGAP